MSGIASIMPFPNPVALKDDPENPFKYTRLNFLRIELGSIRSQGNVQLRNDLLENQATPVPDEVEEWEKWSRFPNLEPYSNFCEGGEALDFLAWVIHNFAPYVCISQGEQNMSAREWYRYQVMETESPLDWINSDDFAFTFLSVQSNINKWHRLHRLLVELRQKEGNQSIADVPNATIRQTVGAEFKKGASMGSAEGLVRYRALTKFFNSNFCFHNGQSQNDKDTVTQNQTALIAKLKRMAQDEIDKIREEADGEEQQEPTKKKARKESAIPQTACDPEYEDINDSQWVLLTGMQGGSSAFMAI